jgi:hypothetical protein
VESSQSGAGIRAQAVGVADALEGCRQRKREKRSRRLRKNTNASSSDVEGGANDVTVGTYVVRGGRLYVYRYDDASYIREIPYTMR